MIRFKYQKSSINFHSYLTLIVWLVTGIQASSQNSLMSFDHLTSVDGLSSNIINCVLMDYQGYVWIGTDDGLDRYDGYSVKEYINNVGDTNSLQSNEIFTLFEDADSNLWIGTRSSLDMYDRKKDRFRHFYARGPNSDNYGHAITSICQYNDSILWMGTIDIGIYVMNTRNFTWKYLPLRSVNYPGKDVNRVKVIYKDNEETIWVGTLDEGLLKYLPDRNAFYSYKNNPDSDNSISSNYIYALSGDPSTGTVFVGTYGGGLNIYNQKTEKFSRFYFNDIPNNSQVNYIKALVFYGDKLWMGTDGEGIKIINFKANSFLNLDPENSNNFTLLNNGITCVYKDHQNNFWVGHYQGGVDIYKSNKKKFIHEYSNAAFSGRFGIDRIYSIFEDSEGNLWTGSDLGRFEVIDHVTKKSKVYHRIIDKKTGIPQNSLVTQAIYEDSHHNMWFGFYHGGMGMFNPTTGKFNYFIHDPDNPNSLINNNVYTITGDSYGNIWIATNGGGIDVFNPQTKKFKNYSMNDSSNFANDWVRPIYEDSKKNMWIGTYWGLSKYLRKEDRFVTYLNIPGDTTSINDNIILTICEDSRHNMWMGTSRGLNRYNEKQDNFTSFTTKDGLPNSTIKGIIEDDKGNLWLSTDKGLSKFDPENLTFKNYDYLDGLQGNSFIRGSYCKGENGRLYFGGMNGYTTFYPDSIKDDPFPPKVLISEVSIFNEPLKIGEEYDGNVILKESLTNDSHLTFKYTENQISITFTGFQYTSPNGIKYSYYLDGVDKTWNNVGADHRKITYSNLSPGKYKFMVKAANKDGVWSKGMATLEFNITPPYWMTTWFRILMIVALIGGIYLFIYFRLRMIRMQKKLLEGRVAEQTSELRKKNDLLLKQTSELNESNTQLKERQQQVEEQTEELLSQSEFLEKTNAELEDLNKSKDRFFSIIAHDLRSPFNTIFGFAELLQQKKDTITNEKRNQYVSALYTSAKRVYILLENLLQWSRTQTSLISFEPRNFLINSVVEEIYNLQEENLHLKSIQFERRINEEVVVFADYEMIQVVLRNLLSNAIKFTPHGGNIILEMKKSEGWAAISIKDTGIGISDEIKNSLFKIDKTVTAEGTDGEKGTGLGLLLCKDFVEKNGGQIFVNSTYGEGAEFSFTLPLKN